jgi:DNA replication and repair protein RecF
MMLHRLWLSDFRSYEQVELELAPGLTALLGDNGQGKTNLLEAIAWLATLGSFRGAPTEALVRRGAPSAVIRAEGEREGRALLLEAQLVPSGRNRVLVNRQPLKRAADLLGVLRVTVFAPDDLELVKGGPAERRRWIDDALVAVHPRNDALRGEVDRVLRQRGALLKQAAMSGAARKATLPEDIAVTLDVWDAKLSQVGAELVAARRALLDRLGPELAATYAAVAGRVAPVEARYTCSWGEDTLADALVASRADDLRRGVTTVGPHRDDVELSVEGLPARTHASQGEQRSLALALRLATHRVVSEATGSPPVLLLDDVFSELDPDRSDALLAHLPPGQTVLSSASGLPPRAVPDRVLRVAGGRVDPEGPTGTGTAATVGIRDAPAGPERSAAGD